VVPIKRRQEKKSGKKKKKKEKGSEGRGVISGILFLTLAVPYKNGAFLL